MRKIKNIHLHDDPNVYQCFGCSPFNDLGLHLEFWEDGDEVVSFWKPRQLLQGYPNVLHGGIQSTLLDEIGGWIVYVKCGTVGFTAEMKVRFKKPVLVDQETITIRGRLTEQTTRMATIHSRLINSSGVVCAEAELHFFLLPETEAREKYNYPGIEAFFD
jgi:uncharacterized protein (TIGR00369 family)